MEGHQMSQVLKLNPDGSLGVEKRGNKFGAKPVTLCLNCCADPANPCCEAPRPHRFASSLEASRFVKLRMLEKAGVIAWLMVQPQYPLIINRVEICKYVADFSYVDMEDQSLVVEDTKSKATRTQVYRIKKKLMKAIYGIDIQEVYQ
jgi:hypothetical protein